MSAAYSWVDLLSLVVATVALAVTLAIFFLGRRMVFRQQRERADELATQAWKVLGPIRTEGHDSKIILMNVARYKRGYDGSNKSTWRGNMYGGVELLDIVHDGIDVAVRGVASYFDENSKRTLTETSDRAPNVIETGHIPWGWIEYINPDGDEFDGSALFFVRNRAPGRHPFDYVTYREAAPVPSGPNQRDYYRPIHELGKRHPKFVGDWWRFLKYLRRERQREAKLRRALANRS